MKKKRPMKSIFENSELYRLLFENSLDAILLTSPDGSIYKANPAACRIFNFTENELKKLGRNAVIDLSDPRLNKALKKRTKENIFFGELTFIRKGGEKFPGEISTSIFKDSDGKKKTSMIIRDITEREIINRNLIKTNRIYSVISQINQLIVHEKNKQKLLNEVCRIAVELGRFRMAWIGFADDSRVMPYAWAGDENGYLSQIKIKKGFSDNEELSAEVLTQRKFRVIKKIDREKNKSWKNKAVRRGFKSAAAFPILLKKKIVGVFCLYSSEADFFDKQEIKFLKETTSDISFALEVLKGEEEKKQFEEALQEKEHLLSESQRIAHIGGWSWDMSGPIKWTDETYRIYGVSPEKFKPTAKSFIKLIHPEDRSLMNKWIETCASGENPGELDFRSVLPDGSFRFLHGRGKLIYDTKKGNTFMTGTVHDTTERRRVEETLHASEYQFRDLWKSTVEGIVILDKDIILEVNDAMCRIFGITSEQAIGKSIFEFASPETHNIIRERLASGSEKPIEIIAIRQEGERILLEVFPKQVTYRGKPSRMVAVRDITERKQTEKALKESEKRLLEAESISHMGFLDWDLKTNKIFLSDEAYRIHGLEKREDLQEPDLVSKSIHPDDREFVMKELQSAIRGEKDYNIDHRILLPDGSLQWVHAQAELIKDSKGVPDKLLGTVIVITERKLSEEALRVSEEKFKLAFKTNPDSININRLSDGVYIDINEGFTRITGYSASDVLGKTSLEIGIWENPEDRKKLVEGLKNHKQVENLEAVFRLKNGSSAYGLMSAAVILLNNEPHILSITKDITDRIKIQEALHQSEVRFGSVIENAVEGITITNESGKVIIWNNAMKYITGINETLTIGKDIWDVELLLEPEKFRTDEEKYEHKKNIKEILNTGRSQFAGKSEEHEFRRTDGKSLFLKRILNVVKTEKGFILVITIEDITERKNAEQALSESEKRYRQLLEVAPVGIAVHQDGKIIFCNPEGMLILGANTNEEIIGKPIEEIIHPGKLQETLSRINKMLAGNKNLYPVDSVYQKLDGTPVDVEVMAAPVIYKERPAIQVIVVDITERKRVEGQLQHLMSRLIESEELMRKSAAQQLHDQVGQNLTALTINLSYIQSQLSGDSKMKIEKRLKDSLTILNDTIEQIRDIMVELQPPVLEDYGLSSALSWSLNKFEERTKIKTVYFGKDFVNRLPYSKEAALFRVFQEILHNIAKHSDADKVEVSLEEKGSEIKLVVKDNGKGFNVDEILQKKERESFGLITMYERISFIGGKINIVSGEGEGTAIEITIGR